MGKAKIANITVALRIDGDEPRRRLVMYTEGGSHLERQIKVVCGDAYRHVWVMDDGHSDAWYSETVLAIADQMRAILALQDEKAMALAD